MVTEVLAGESISLLGKPASILEEQRNFVFTDVACGYASTDPFTYCVSSTGVLCMFNNESRMVDKWVQLESAASFCLELLCDRGASGLLAVGCSNGTVRCFSPTSLDYIATLPLPAPLSSTVHTTDGASYPACYALRKVAGTKASPVPKLASVYADHSLFVWDVSDIYSVAKYRSFLYHQGCIWDIQFIEGGGDANSSSTGGSAARAMSPSGSKPSKLSLPPGSFVTCSADQTVKIWNTDPRAQRDSKYRSVFSREMLHSIDIPRETERDLSRRNDVMDSLNTTVSTSFGALSGVSTVAPVDLSLAMPDTEGPDKPPTVSVPRALAVHPYGHQLAVGSKAGRLRVFDLQTMKEKVSTIAHAAEILTMHYSPPLVSVDAGRNWTVDIDPTAIRSPEDEPMVLLATAGRDRLIHVFNASMQYSPIDTLDHHSSSVTIVRFTSDGRKLISCGGDKNMVFSGVNGPEITKLKTVATPNGAVNGLALDATNKFAITTGHDKKLNVWNVQSGKHMRAYKSDQILQELYKSDIDPSGMYVATCAFDRSVYMFDFFSGELVAQVTGHSDLVTGVRFTPDGQHLVTIGGDGCIMMWRLADYLVKHMQDRLVEMVANAQKKNEKSDLPPRPATTGGAAYPVPAPLGVGALMPPAPPTAAEQQRPSTAAAPSSNPATKPHPSKWGAKGADEGYELFGRKIVPAVAPPLNQSKFTAELDVTMDEAAPEISSLSLSVSPSRLARSLEAKDDVQLSLSDDETGTTAHKVREVDSDDDDESDGSHLFTAEEVSYDSDPDHEGDASKTDKSLEAAGSRLNSLEASAQHVESWLENVLHNDSNIDENVAVVAAASSSQDLEQSMSAAFFKDLRTSGAAESRSALVRRASQSVEASPIDSKPVSADEAANTAAEIKKRDRAATVARMKERMRVMGAEKARKAAEEAAAAAATEEEEEYADDTDTASPAKPLHVDKPSSIAPEESFEETAVMSQSASEAHSARSNGGRSVRDSVDIAQELTAKSTKYRSILSDLERARRQAADSYQELINLRSSLEESMNVFSPAPVASHSQDIDLNASMAETDQLLGLFRDSFAQLGDTHNAHNRSHSHMSFPSPGSIGGGSFRRQGGSTSGSVMGDDNAAEVERILERYSDRLLEMVSGKILSQSTK
eukprot:gene23932-30216_t